MQMQRIATVFAVAAVMAAIVSADDESDSNKADQPSKPLVGIGAAIRPPPPKDGKQLIEQGGEIFYLLPNSPAALCGETRHWRFDRCSRSGR